MSDCVAHNKKAWILASLLCFAAMACVQSWANGQGIYSNMINDPNPSTADPFNAGDVLDPNLTATGLARGPGITPNAGSNRYNAANWSFPNIDAGDYFTWTITPAAGYQIDFTSLAGMWQRSSTGPKNYVLETSRDGFASQISSGGISGSGSASAYSVDLSSLQDVDSAIEIRLLAYGGTGASGTFSINDFEFDGVVEQSTGGTTPMSGDYNGDGVVDAADYVVWRASSADGTALLNETVSPGTTDQADFDEWRANFGNPQVTGGGASLHSTGVAVPEPSSAFLITIAIFAGCVRHFGKRDWRGCRLQSAM
ncbi:MAG TPA: hypothetical protein VGI75_12240 [Pirellulales bacterium]